MIKITCDSAVTYTKITAITTEIIEIENVSFVPTTRVNKSLPKSSVPNGWARLGPCNSALN